MYKALIRLFQFLRIFLVRVSVVFCFFQSQVLQNHDRDFSKDESEDHHSHSNDPSYGVDTAVFPVKMLKIVVAAQIHTRLARQIQHLMNREKKT